MEEVNGILDHDLETTMDLNQKLFDTDEHLQEIKSEIVYETAEVIDFCARLKVESVQLPQRISQAWSSSKAFLFCCDDTVRYVLISPTVPCLAAKLYCFASFWNSPAKVDPIPETTSNH